MSLNEIISKQLKSYPNFKKQARIGYFESTPLKQVHIDTAFWQPSGELNVKKTPFLVIVDVATRYTGFYVQDKKNQNIRGFLGEFCQEVKKKFPTTTKEMLLITDGAPELKLSGEIAEINVQSKVSKGINKAVLAEVAIRQARAILREFELALNLKNIENGTDYRINGSNLKEVLAIVQDRINLKAKLREPKPSVPYKRSKFMLGSPVFALNFYKYYPHALKASMVKRSYMQNWYYEPFKISRIFLIKGVYKYSISSYIDGKEIKYNFYEDQLQLIDPKYAADYIHAYRKNAAKIADSEE